MIYSSAFPIRPAVMTEWDLDYEASYRNPTKKYKFGF